MKKTFLLLATCMLSMLASSQILEVVSVETLATASHPDARVAGISPKGDYVLITDGGENGLHRYDLASKKLTTITKAPAAGFNVQISADGNELAFSEMCIEKDRSITHNIHRVNFASNTKAKVAEKQSLLTDLRFAEANVSIVNEECQIYLMKNGKKIHIAPQGEEYTYIWQSLSPAPRTFLLSFCKLWSQRSDRQLQSLQDLAPLQPKCCQELCPCHRYVLYVCDSRR